MQWVKMWGMHRLKLGYTVGKNRHSFMVGDLGEVGVSGGVGGDGEWKKMGVVYNLIHR